LISNPRVTSCLGVIPLTPRHCASVVKERNR